MRSGKHVLLAQDNHHQEKAQDDVEDAAGGHHQKAFPHRLVAKGPGVAAVLVLALHGAVAANGQQAQAVLGLPFLKANQFWPHAQGKLVDPDARGLCQQEMSQLVKENDKAKKQNAYQDE